MNGHQLNLFTNFAVERAVKSAMHDAAKKCGLSRAQIVDKMEELAARSGVKLTSGSSLRLSEDTLEKWLNPHDTERVIPLKGLPIFCEVVRSLEPIQALTVPLDAQVINSEDAVLLQVARIDREIRRARAEKRKLEQKGWKVDLR